MLNDTKEEYKENKMGVMPMNKLVLTMSLPMMVSMLMQALYNIVDSIFVAQISENALAAVSIALPVQLLMIAVSVGTGIGINSLLSRRLGEHNKKAASSVAENGMFLGAMSSLVFAIFGLIFAKPFMSAFAVDPEIIAMGTQYVSIVTIFSFGQFLLVTTERIMQSTGNTVYNMIVQGVGAILNIILDPIMIFGLFGFPKMGVAGAAVATVVGQIIAMFLGIYISHKKVKEIHLNFRHFRPSGSAIKNIYRVGIPSIVMQSIMSVMTVGMNKILMPFSQTAVSVLGVYFKLQNFIFLPVFGLTNALIPIVAYNYGARNRKRIVDSVKISLVYAVGIMGVGTLIFYKFPRELLMMFKASEHMLEIGIPALRIISLCFMLAGVSIVCSSVFQALGKGVLSLISSVVRQLIVILPCAYLLATRFGLGYVWLAFPISEMIAVIMSVAMFIYVYKKVIVTVNKE